MTTELTADGRKKPIDPGEQRPCPPPDNPIAVTPEEVAKSSHARFVHRWNTEPAFRARTTARRYADESAALMSERGKTTQHVTHAERTKAIIEARGPTPESNPNPLRANAAVYNTFRLISDLPEETICSPSFLKLNVPDVKDAEARVDQIAIGDQLEVYDPVKKRLRFAKRAIAVDIDRRAVSWEDVKSG